jgi:cytoskeletal protein RodZ
MADTPGYLLKIRRVSKNLNIAQVAKATRIRTIYIQAMEDDDFASLPSRVHARGFLRAYAEFLGLNAEDLITKLATEYQHHNPDIADKPSELHNDTILDTSSEPGKETFSEDLIIISSEPSIEKAEEKVDLFQQESIQTSEQQKILPQLNSKKIFSSIGDKLRNQREALSLSLNEVEKHSRVLKRYLEAIEAGEFDELPSSVQSRGMLTNSSRFLEIDTDEILLLFADGLQAQLLEKHQSEKRQSSSAISSRNKYSLIRRYVSIDLLFGSGLIILLIIFAIWGTGKVIDLSNATASTGSAASISDIILTPIQSATIAGVEETIQTVTIGTSTPAIDATYSEIPVNGQGQVQVYVVVLQRTWLRISVDNKISLEGRVEPGNAYSFNGNKQVQVLTGNGAALQIIYNQTDLGVMGAFGEVVENIYTPNSIIKPTATITPTPTITPKPSMTPRFTSTQIP